MMTGSAALLAGLLGLLASGGNAQRELLLQAEENGVFVPWVAALVKRITVTDADGNEVDAIQYFCTGSLIHDRHILTSSSCFADPDNQPDLVAVSQYDLSSGEIEPQTRVQEIRRLIQLPGNEGTLNDLALVEMNGPVLRTQVEPAFILQDESVIEQPGTEVMTYGWSVDPNNLQAGPGKLKTKRFNIRAKERCQEIIPQPFTRYLMCAGAVVDPLAEQKPNATRCVGDVGSPVIYQRNGIPIVLGVLTQARFGCGDPNYLGTYTRVSQYYSWLAEYINVGLPPPEGTPVPGTWSPTPAPVPLQPPPGSTIGGPLGPEPNGGDGVGAPPASNGTNSTGDSPIPLEGVAIGGGALFLGSSFVVLRQLGKSGVFSRAPKEEEEDLDDADDQTVLSARTRSNLSGVGSTAGSTSLRSYVDI